MKALGSPKLDAKATPARPNSDTLSRRTSAIDLLHGMATRVPWGAFALLAAGLMVALLASLFTKADFTPFGRLASRADYSGAWLVFWGGTIINLLLFGLTLSFRNTRAYARRMAEQLTAELRESEANFRTFFDTVDDIILVGHPDGKIIYSNPAASARLGYSSDELKGMHLLDLRPSDKRQEAEAIITASFKGEQVRCSLPLQSKSGALIPGETLAWFGRWNDAGCIFCIFKDLTKEQEALQKFARLFGSNPAPMAVSSLPDRRFTDVNNAFLNTLGYTRAEVLGKTAEELGLFVEPEKQRIIGDELKACGRIVNCELKVKSKEGTILDGLFSGEIIASQGQNHFLTVMTDQTKRKRAEAALRQNEEKFSRAFQTAPYSITITRAEDGKFVEVNDAFTSMTGFTREEALTDSSVGLKLWVNEDDRQHVVTALRAGLAVVGQEYTFRLKRGDIITGLLSAQKIHLGHEPCILSSINNITEHKRAEAELQKMQKLRSVGTLAGGIAHDFNNILMGLFGNIALAKDKLSKDHPVYTLIEEAEKSMNRAVRLTNQLLTFAKGGDPIKEDVSLGTLVEEVARFDLSGSNTRLVYRQAEKLWMAEADKGQIQQVIANLTINARQAMPDGGRLYINLENASITEADTFGLHQGKYVKLTVRDEGIGIDPKHLDRIFDPYFTTKQTGNGLGLATAYSIIKKHGGHIGVVSELGKGTTFTFYLPASESQQAEEIKQPAAECPLPTRHVSILVMDDEEMVCGIVTKILTRCGFSVATAPGGQETIEMYKQAMDAGTPFDVVIMDLTIPGGIGGKEAIKNLLAIDPKARAIVSSGYADDPVMANFAEHGFKGIAVKPYTPSQLWNVLGLVLKS